MGSGAGRLWGWCLLEQVSLSIAKDDDVTGMIQSAVNVAFFLSDNISNSSSTAVPYTRYFCKNRRWRS